MSAWLKESEPGAQSGKELLQNHEDGPTENAMNDAVGVNAYLYTCL